MNEHYQEALTLDELARQFYVNKFYLTRIFKEQCITINHYIQQLRITHAKQLLRFSELSIEAIGEQCGLKDAKYFSRMFKPIEGIAPGNFRKSWVSQN